MFGTLGGDLVVLGILIKLLLFPAYFSTDFDVHRNWLAITHHLPLTDWYFEATSQWTLDYPPFFAYFEYALSHLVPQWAIKDGCLNINAQDGMYGWPTIVFQRSSVLATELVFAYGVGKIADAKTARLLWLCPAWLVLDHMHFQYNTALFGIFILSVVSFTRKHYLKSAFLFSSLLCFKHIFIYVAPAYVFGLFYQYVLDGLHSLSVGAVLDRGAKLALVTLAPLAAAFGPFIYHDYVQTREGLLIQIMSRLFPFSRGLTHSYWAPNFWALYSFADRVLGVYNKNSVVSATRGIVGQVEFSNLPEITAGMTFKIVAGLQLLSVLKVGAFPHKLKFVESLTLCAFASFLFGYHVHEKAVLMAVVPFALLLPQSRRHVRAFLPLLVAASFSLFPLIWTPAESVLKSVYTWTFLLVVFIDLPQLSSGAGVINWLYFMGFGVVMPAYALIPYWLPKYEYAGLMLVSVYSALGVILSWLQLLWLYFRY